MKVLFCDMCSKDMTGDRVYNMHVTYHNDYGDKVNAMPLMEVCPICKEWLRECIEIRSSKEVERRQS